MCTHACRYCPAWLEASDPPGARGTGFRWPAAGLLCWTLTEQSLLLPTDPPLQAIPSIFLVGTEQALIVLISIPLLILFSP